MRRFWDRVKQGVAILTEPRRYLRQVAAWQGVGWLCRFAAFWFFLEAFGIGGSFGNVLLVMSVQAIANIIPFTPGGAGAQQALLAATLTGPSRTTVLAFSVGTQIAMAAWSVVLGFGAILLVFRTTDWRGLIGRPRTMRSAKRRAGQDRLRREAGTVSTLALMADRLAAGRAPSTRAYEEGDREVVEKLLAEDFVFHSPPDPGIGRADLLRALLAQRGDIASSTSSRLTELGDEVLVTYEATRDDGSRFRNTEILRFAGDLIAAVEVYFGWDLDDQLDQPG